MNQPMLLPCNIKNNGDVVERPMAPDLKSGDPKGSVSSNLTVSASFEEFAHVVKLVETPA